MNIEYAVVCDSGLREGDNQDSVFCAESEGTGVFLVADGMGGHRDGGWASRCVRQEISQFWKHNAESADFADDIDDSVASLKKALKAANRYIFLPSRVHNGCCGSTAVVLWICGDTYTICSSGDSRCYMVTGNILKKDVVCVTRDDVWENNPDNIEGLSLQEIVNHKNYGKLLKAVGTEENFTCSLNTNKINGKTLFVICSDGIYKYIPEKVFLKTIKSLYGAKKEDLEKGCSSLLEEVYKAGAPDNASVILVSVR